MARPGVVWFGESLPDSVWQRAEKAAIESDIFLVAGTAGVVYPAAGLVALAKRNGALTIEINLAESALSTEVDRSLRGPAGEILPALLTAGAVA
jgi:NAD-dependent deacetylase